MQVSQLASCTSEATDPKTPSMQNTYATLGSKCYRYFGGLESLNTTKLLGMAAIQEYINSQVSQLGF